jgi:hemerythrin superfamily protein
MKATDLLKKQHKEVRDLFKKIEKSKDDATKSELFEELAANLVAHDGIERQIFYPACEEAMGMTDILGESLVEHGVVEFMLYQADQAQGEDDFEYKCTVLQEMVEHHVEEEEKEFFPKVERALGKERLEEIGMEMEEAFEEAKQEDFRTPLHANLQQVIAGAIKPAPTRRAPSSRKKAPSRKSSPAPKRNMRKSA